MIYRVGYVLVTTAVVDVNADSPEAAAKIASSRLEGYLGDTEDDDPGSYGIDLSPPEVKLVETKPVGQTN